MNILLLGSGGREHAIAWKMVQSPHLSHLFIAPGNAGTGKIGTNVPLSPNDFPAIREFVLTHSVRMVVVGPEDPLVNGIHDQFLADPLLKGIPVIGPVKQAAMLEGSKEFAKQFMTRHNIPTAAFHTFDSKNLEEGFRFIEKSTPPIVVKADGLAAGKGVVICQSREEARNELIAMIRDAKFGESSRRVVIEEFLRGIEISVFVITDGRSYKILPSAKDYKKIGTGDTGPNTGGMGSVSPVPFAGREFMRKVETRIIKPTLAGLIKENIDYQGFIFFGLINVDGDPYVIEYNCRLGDPETESIIPRLKNDLIELFYAVANRSLKNIAIRFDKRYAATVMLVSEGYPGKYEKGKAITGEDTTRGSILFHSGTSVNPENQETVTNGGRVLAITSLGRTMDIALKKSYENADKIRFQGKYFRNDIGFDLKKGEQH
ncbi:MAG: phosphoribosylamine--glycine ligase [Bacteroidota bacterium]|nr:phosphoribosylamine--glycine ligase [Bacteroidota bacterium]